MDIPGKQSGGYPPAPSVGIPAAGVNQYYNPAEHLPPPLQVETQGALTPWSTGLCQCCDDVGNCCITCWCPCVTFGRIAEIIDRGSSSCGMSGALYALIFCVSGCSCLYSCFYRTKLRSQYSLPEGPCPDCLVHCCCESCALCQEYRELKNRGFDMDIVPRARPAVHPLTPSPQNSRGVSPFLFVAPFSTVALLSEQVNLAYAISS